MKPTLALAALASLALAAAPAHATLSKGAKAPAFVAKGAQAGKPITFDLAQALKKGPVVLYFFPAAFTPGCNIEAETFAASPPETSTSWRISRPRSVPASSRSRRPARR